MKSKLLRMIKNLKVRTFTGSSLKFHLGLADLEEKRREADRKLTFMLI